MSIDVPARGRLALLARGPDQEAAGLVRTLLSAALRALPPMYRAESQEFVQTARRDPADRSALTREGTNLRYSLIVGLGASSLDESAQRALLAGSTAAELTRTVAARVPSSPDPGAAALAAWAAAEVTGAAPGALFDRLARDVRASRARATVEYAWMLTALVAARGLADLQGVTAQAAERLLAAQEPSGLFPHALPRETLGRLRSHVGCFADQVYPIQALARYGAATGDGRALAAADRAAAVIVGLQGPAGQWWWHYDVRTARVVEPFPVYSVHQHAMAPMALLDLRDAGGTDHLTAVAAGVEWVRSHPETDAALLDEATGAIWRKVGRREPRKLVRSIRAASTSVAPRLTVGLLDRAFPAGVVDHECRPYELGWLLYAWHSARIAGPSGHAPDPGVREEAQRGGV